MYKILVDFQLSMEWVRYNTMKISLECSFFSFFLLWIVQKKMTFLNEKSKKKSKCQLLIFRLKSFNTKPTTWMKSGFFFQHRIICTCQCEWCIEICFQSLAKMIFSINFFLLIVFFVLFFLKIFFQKLCDSLWNRILCKQMFPW